MSKINKNQILDISAELFAETGYSSFTIRRLAKTLDVSPSVIYHYFLNEDALLDEMFKYLNTNLGINRAKLKLPLTAAKMLKQRIEFQFDNARDIVAVLKYYLYFRKNFEKQKHGFLPEKSTLHIEEVIEYGIKTNEFSVKNIKDDSLVITHAINGFLLEYYPTIPSGNERKLLINKIYRFLIKALRGGDNNE